ncbi:MAG: TolC family protein [Prevotellaceae bacterium]|jgi:outer membrane protein TolC|nr:TolC family protein [Prevotellaceae bacterium]
MKNKTTVLFLLIFCLSAQSQVLTLSEAIQTGIEHNLTLKEGEEDVRKMRFAKSESRARLLPVIEGFANFQDHVERGVQITDGSTLSQLLYPVTHTDIPYLQNKGLRYNTSAGVQLVLPLYNQTIYTSMKIADKMLEMSRYSMEKAKEDLTVEICKIYYQAQITTEQINLIQKNRDVLEELSAFTRAFNENGMALDVDVKRVEINLENLSVQCENAKVLYEQQLNVLKYILDISPESRFELEQVDTSEQQNHFNTGLFDRLYELKMLDAQKEILEQQKKAVNVGYTPSLSFITQLGTINSVDNFDKYFYKEPPSEWHWAFYWGFSLKVPIFDGLAKKYQADKIKVDYRKSKFAREDAEKKLNEQYQNMLLEWENNNRNFQRQKDNYTLAEEVYNLTFNRYKEGLASMSELLQDEMSENNAQNNYLSALYQCKVSEIGLMKLTGTINNYIK